MNNGGFGDISLGQNEAKRISNTLLGIIDSGNISEMANLIMENGYDLTIKIEEYLQKMEVLDKELRSLFAHAFALEDLVKKRQQEYTEYKQSKDADPTKIALLWNNLVLLAEKTEEEFRRVNSLSEPSEIRAQMQELYLEYEEVLLALGNIIAPTTLDSEF